MPHSQQFNFFAELPSVNHVKVIDKMSAANPSSAFEHISLEGRKVDITTVDLIPGEFALKNQVLPLSSTDGKVVVAIGNVDSLPAVQDLEILIGQTIEPVLTDPVQLKDKIEEVFLEKILSQVAGANDADTTIIDSDDNTDLADLTKMAGETAVVQMVNLIFAQSFKFWCYVPNCRPTFLLRFANKC